MHPNPDAACFHAQQCVEKYLKARLAEAGLPVKKNHDLVALAREVAPVEPGWSAFSQEFGKLTQYAVKVRYPGPLASRADALEALRMCRAFRQAARAAFGLKS